MRRTFMLYELLYSSIASWSTPRSIVTSCVNTSKDVGAIGGGVAWVITAGPIVSACPDIATMRLLAEWHMT